MYRHKLVYSIKQLNIRKTEFVIHFYRFDRKYVILILIGLLSAINKFSLNNNFN